MNKNYSTLVYLNNVYQSLKPAFSFKAKNKEEWKRWRGELKDKLFELLGDFPQSKSPLNARLLEKEEQEDHFREKIVFESEPGVLVPTYILIPKNIKFPGQAVIALHGHIKGGKKSAVGIYEDEEEKERTEEVNGDYGLQMVKKGYIVAAPDQRCFGEREEPKAKKEGGHCFRSSMDALLLGKTMIGMRVWDIMRCIDYLQERKDVNKDKIGCLGLSGGGTTTLFASALDERIKVVVVSGYFCSFKASIFDLYHCSCNYIPRILKYAEMSDIAGLITPRPLLVETGTKDPIFPTLSTQKAYKKLGIIYELLGEMNKLNIDIFEGKHRFSGSKSFDWFKKWL